jgi:acyl-coenzyme A synthetase/AMP-(fatty) acid ligase
MIRKISRGLNQKGVKQGDRVSIFSRNNIYYIPVVLGIIAAGAVGVPIPASYSALQAADTLKLSASSWIFADPKIPAAEAAGLAGLDNSHVLHFDPRNHSRGDLDTSFLSVIEHGEMECAPVDPQTIAFLLSTSGSTGRPKLVVLSHANLVAQQSVVDEIFHPEKKPYEVKWIWHRQQASVGSFTVPFSAFRTGHPFYIVTGKHPEGVASSFTKHGCTGQDPEGLSSAIMKFGITDAVFVPDDIESLYENLGQNGHLQLSSLKHVFVTGKPVRGFHYQSFLKLLGPKARLVRGMGSTECSGWLFWLPWPGTHTERQADQGWVGQLAVPDVHVKYIHGSSFD